MDEGNLLKKVDLALRVFYDNDSNLLEIDANERTVAHRFALYLEFLFEGRNVDCEYNRYGDELGPKTLPGIEHCNSRKETDWIIPDILIHTRKSRDKDNLAVFEIKVGKVMDLCDERKLSGMTKKDGRFKYDYGLFVCFYEDSYQINLFTNGDYRELKPIIL
jgi:hypothetical protein